MPARSNSSRIDTLVVDKTGTLTEGRPKVVAVSTVEGIDETQLLKFAASVERSSEHPLAQAEHAERFVGFFRDADLVIFDPATIRDTATYEEPQKLAEGVSDLLVNGVPVRLDGKFTDQAPGRVLRKK